MKTMTALGALLAAALTMPAGATRPISYTVTELPMSWATDINDAGQITGGQYIAPGVYTGLVLDPHAPPVTIYGRYVNPQAEAFAINQNGVAVGTMATDAGERGFTVQNGVVTTLDPPAGSIGMTVKGINNLGEAVGYGTVPGFGQRGYLFSGGMLTTFAFDNSTTAFMDINDAGQITGQYLTPADAHGNVTVQAFVYQNGYATMLAGIGGNRSWGTVINAQGDVGGSAEAANGQIHAMLWDSGQAIDLSAAMGSGYGEVWGINDLGEAVGRASLADDYHGFLYADGAAIDINTLIDPASGWLVSTTNAINNHGAIVAGAYRGDDYSAVLLTPVYATSSPAPEPGTWALMLAGFAAVGTALRRTRRLRVAN